MNRRQILKSCLLFPFVGLFKSRKSAGLTISQTDICNDALSRISDTFQPGDRVWIGTLPNSMRHFQSHQQATVLYSYAGKYGGKDDNEDYALEVDGHGFHAWYPGVCLSKLSETSGTSSARASWSVWYDENGCRRRSDDIPMIMLKIT